MLIKLILSILSKLALIYILIFQTQKPVAVRKFKKMARSVAFSSDGKLISVGMKVARRCCRLL